ncbi:MAG: hypothetical protein EOO06_02655 [Chitinophagaceae bacterium]|nr:MAG: hypothetical protein EOO06_02655 [Chitinophagaceae bacterium]
MKVKYLIGILPCIFGLLNTSPLVAQTTPVDQGLYHNYDKVPTIDSSELNRLWFTDSAIIYELKVDIEMDETDSTVYRGYDVYGYRYFDIPSNTYYEYNSFTDTASVTCKYLDEERFVGGFFSTKNKPLPGAFIVMSDTTINGEIFKRVKFTQSSPEFDMITETIYYFASSGYKSDLFGLLTAFNSLVPGCAFRRVELTSYSSGQVKSGFGNYEIVRSFLTKEEEKIFSRWKKNTMDKSIPMSTVADMQQLPISPIKFRGNPKYPWFN